MALASIGIDMIRRRLERTSSPRVHMALIVSVATSCALFTSYALLRLGVTNMGERYPLSVVAGYVSFVGAL